MKKSISLPIYLRQSVKIEKVVEKAPPIKLGVNIEIPTIKYFLEPLHKPISKFKI